MDFSEFHRVLSSKCIWMALLSVACAFSFAVITKVEVDAAVPTIPLAELVFAPYNDHMMQQIGGREEATKYFNSGNDFCFISHGCWGGKPPQVKGQQNVSALIAQLIERSDNDPSAFGGRVRFVVAAGDNFYTRGVKSVYDDRFFTSFENFYKDVSHGKKVRRVPWIVALGNHDYRGNWLAQVNYTYATRNQEKYAQQWAHHAHQGTLVSGRWYIPQPYFALKVSHDTVLVVIDTVLLHRCALSNDAADCWDNDAQRKIVEHWLLHEYASVPYKVVVGHYPVLSNGPHPNFLWLKEWLIPLMRHSCASIYIHADNHYLQVSKDGPQYYANSGGGGGLHLHAPMTAKSWTTENSVFHAVSYGVMVHCRTGDEFTHRVIDASGTLLFRFVSWDASKGTSLHACMRRLGKQTSVRPQKIAGYVWALQGTFLLVLCLVVMRRRRWYQHRRLYHREVLFFSF